MVIATLACLFLTGANPALSQQVHRVSVLMDAGVAVQDSDNIGKIVDLVVNENGCIEYAVVSYEQNYILVPWSVTTVNFERKVVRVNITRERLREVPTFTRDRWPNFSEGQFREKLHKAFGVQAGRKEGGAERPGTTGNRPGTERKEEKPNPDIKRPNETEKPKTKTPDTDRPKGNEPEKPKTKTPDTDRPKGNEPAKPPVKPRTDGK